ncbi:hypothetical protein FACS1894166_05170 [Bacilli bacterium]|nr:hypothetical protein FACS1894166_05170 [Bacilli bacterium]
MDQLSHICTFGEYLDICKKCDKHSIVEIKQPGLDKVAIKKIIDLIIKKGLKEKCYFISFDYHALELARELAPSIPSMYLIETKSFRQNGIGREGMIRAISNKQNVSCRHWLMTKKIMALAKANKVLTGV